MSMGSRPPPPPPTGSWPTGDPSDSSHSSSSDGVPIGLWIIVAVGFLGAFLSFLGSMTLISTGYGVIGIVVLGLAALEIVVLVGLLAFRFWAYAVALVVFSLGVVIDLATFDFLGFVINLSIICYLFVISNRYE
ncbi:hypothetical protein BB347_11165 [Natronorubrum daqingense]|uniref:Uncharacterized protein n=2 Tax=Natronorubrum daqingense TaxID=588898 RepID=A0A1P8REN0_9EURY|nr:hypothetical protein BB347_11165 [Natronorubrum daqingense]